MSPKRPISGLFTVDYDELRRLLAQELVSGREAGAIVGVDPKRIQQLDQERRLGKRSDFPEPAVERGGARLWFREEMREYADGRSARPGPAAGSGRAPLRVRRPQALQGYSDQRLAGALEDPATGLTTGERDLLSSRLGLDGTQKSQGKLAEELGVSRQTVIFRQNRAVEKLLAVL